MFSRLMPREGKYFELFNAHAQQMLLGAKELVALMESFGPDGNSVQLHTRNIDEIESKADEITHEVMSLMHKTFVTPLDRDEIHQLINGMDDILDLIEDVADIVILYDVKTATPEMRSLAITTLQCVDRVKTVVEMISNMDNGQKILSICREISELESEADRTMRAGMSKLFREEPDVRQVLKLKAVYEVLESVSDRCEYTAKVIESIVLENS